MALAGLLVFVAGLCLVPVEETDLFFRLAAGEQFLRSGSVLHENLFSFTYPDQSYLDPAWMFDAGAAALFRLGGFSAMVLAKTILVMMLAAFAYRLCRRRGAGPVATAFALALAFWCMRERLVERPHLFSLLGEVAVFALIPFLESGDRRGWVVVPVVALWANLHAGAFLAPVLLGLAAVGIILDRAPWRAVPRLALAGLLTGTTLMATPVGPGIFDYLTFHIGIFDLHPVDEFRSVTWRSDAGFLLFALSGLVAIGLSRRIAWRDRLPAFGFVLMAGWHVRFTADAVLVLAMVAAPAIQDFGSRWGGRILEGRTRFSQALLFAVLTLATVAPRAAEAARGGRFIEIDLKKHLLPLDALRFAEDNGLREHMYNDFEIGAYLLWQGYPRFRVFVDPRLPAYPRSFHALLGRMDVTRDDWTHAMSALGVQSALLDYAGINRRAALWDPEQWALLFRAKDSRVFVRRLPKWRALIAKHEIPATFSFTVEDGAITRPLLQPPATSPVPTCEWQVRLGDLYFDLDQGKLGRAIAAYRAALAAPAGCLGEKHELAATSWVGSLDVANKRFAEALPLLDRALALAPSDRAVLTNRALALDGLGRDHEAREAWSRIADLSKGTELGRRAAERASR